jgi:hypothetical protein
MNELCGHPTLEGGPCTHPVAGAEDHCAAGHPVAVSAAPSGATGATAAGAAFDMEDLVTTASPALDLSTRSPSQIDVVLSEFWQEEQRLQLSIVSDERFVADQKRRGHTYDLERIGRRIEDKTFELAELRRSAEPYEAQYNARPWRRYFVVLASNGHVHSGMHCTTCFATTAYNWLPELSGAAEEEMVAQLGETACTVCFPSAPTYRGFGDGTSTLARYSESERAQRRQEKEARAAAKAAKRLPRPLKVPSSSWKIETWAAAKSELYSAVDWAMVWGVRQPSTLDEYRRTIATLRRVLEDHGEDTTALIDKRLKKTRRDAGGSRPEEVLLLQDPPGPDEADPFAA